MSPACKYSVCRCLQVRKSAKCAPQRGCVLTEHDGSALIHARSSFGHFVYRAEFKDRILVSSTYLHNG